MSSTSGKLWPVSTCSNPNGSGAGANAFNARCSITIESLPPENSSTGRSNSAATSRMMCTASASSARRWVCAAAVSSWVRMLISGVQSALGLGVARPAPGPRILARQRLARAGLAADRGVALLEQRVGQDAVAVDVGVDLVLGPRRLRRDLDHVPLGAVADHPEDRDGGGVSA